MNTKLADPSFEPTDEELRELSRAAFSEVEAEHQRELERLFNRIAATRRANASAQQLSEK